MVRNLVLLQLVDPLLLVLELLLELLLPPSQARNTIAAMAKASATHNAN
jgi:hypothetical protein